MVLSISPELATVNSTCGNIDHIEVAPHALSCELEFTTDKEHWYSSPGNSGTITITKKNDPTSYCQYHYDYIYKLIPYSYFDIRSENISPGSCHGNMKSSEISVMNDHNQALPRSIDGSLGQKGAEVTESLSQADCGGQGGDNCMIISPDMNTQYLTNGSTLAESLRLQTEIARYEPLNFEQFIGSHNSAISQHYTNSTSTFDLSHSDPDSYINLTEQLNSGVRQIELDIEWYNNSVTLCHNHVSTSLEGILCEGNAPISTALREIKSWVAQNPQALVFVYLDVNLPLTQHVSNLDNELAQLEPYVFTPAMAKRDFGVTDNTLPAAQLSQYDIVNRYKKNIIITNDDDVENLKTSQYAFVKVKNSNDTPLPENSVTTFTTPNFSCRDSNKYSLIKNIYSNDIKHNNLLRVNGDRTTIDYVNSVGDKHPEEYSDYFTLQNIPELMNCPLNVFSTNMLGYTCDSNNCDSHPTDPRFYAFLWSWGLGYPLKSGGSDIAYINPKTGHFENDALIKNETYSILCYRPTSRLEGPTAPLDWFTVSMKITNANQIISTAQESCKNAGGVFAVPTTSYWMQDVLQIITSPTIVNYQKKEGEWVPDIL